MTVQKKDHMSLDGDRFTLLCIERDKEIADHTKFIMPAKVTKDNLRWSTGCYKGYTMEFYSIQKKLYAAKKQDIWCDDDIKEVESKRIFVPFTGSCVIARGGNYCSVSNRTMWYIEYNEAFELYFEKGVLKEKRSLASSIEKAKPFIEVRDKDYDSARQILLEGLKYKYE